MRKSRNAILITFLLCLGVMAKAQQDRVYLKNGGLVRGSLIKIDRQEFIVKIDSTTEVRLDPSAIQNIRMRRLGTRLTSHELFLIDSLNHLPKTPRIYSQFGIGMLFGEDGTYRTGLANLSMEYSLHRMSSGSSSIGLGVGLDYYPSFRVMPIFVEYRRYLRQLPSGFFFYGRFGFSRANARTNFEFAYNSVRADETFGLGMGHQWSLGEHYITFSMGYNEQMLRTAQQNGAFESFTDWKLRRMSFKITVTF